MICHRPLPLFLFAKVFSICTDLKMLELLKLNICQNLTFSFRVYSFSRLLDRLHNLSPPSISLLLPFVQKSPNPQILLLGISPNTCASHILLFPKALALLL